ncbi:MAG TPA: hypothetical protein VFJ82_04930 [Longimicrobium sp.]|nr:hypothetical protein [Longimicrobium sp.]
MDKLKLSLESLKVESFATHREPPPQGTVRAHQATDFNECGISNPCTTDGQATIDAVLCAASQCSACDATVGPSCRNATGFCCGASAARTNVCCQGTANCG